MTRLAAIVALCRQSQEPPNFEDYEAARQLLLLGELQGIVVSLFDQNESLKKQLRDTEKLHRDKLDRIQELVQ